MKKYVLSNFDLSKVNIPVPVFEQKSRPKVEYNTVRVYVDIIISSKNKWKEKVKQLHIKNPLNHTFELKEQKKYISFYKVFTQIDYENLKHNNVLEYRKHIFKVNAYSSDILYIIFKRSTFKNYSNYTFIKGLILSSILISTGIKITKIKIIIVRTGQVITIDLDNVDFKYILEVLDQLLNQYKQIQNTKVNLEQVGWCHNPYTLFKLNYPYPTQIYFDNRSGLVEFEKMIEKPFSGNIFIHSPNMNNICSNEQWFISLVRRALHLCDQYNMKGVVVHVGKSVNLPIKMALEQMKSNLIDFVRYSPKDKSFLLLETPAGQKTEVLTTPELFGEFYNKIDLPHRDKIKLCLDTCHVFAAGYLPHIYLEKMIKIVGENKIGLVHFNDSLYPKGCHIDRHAPVGTGYIPINSLEKVRKWCHQNGVAMVREY